MMFPKGSNSGDNANVAHALAHWRFHAQAHQVKKSTALLRPDGGVAPCPPPPPMGLPKAPPLGVWAFRPGVPPFAAPRAPPEAGPGVWPALRRRRADFGVCCLCSDDRPASVWGRPTGVNSSFFLRSHLML